jgi:hypothetical protein
MHFAYGGRKASHPPPYASRSKRSAILNTLRRMPPRRLAVAALSLLGFFWLLSWMFGSSSSSGDSSPPAFTKAPAGKPNVVLVTTIDPRQDPFFTDALKQNRRDYAAKHGRRTFNDCRVMGGIHSHIQATKPSSLITPTTLSKTLRKAGQRYPLCATP